MSGTLLMAFLWVGIIFLSVLVHEWGHAFLGVMFDQKVQIHLVAFGGNTSRVGPKLSLAKEFIVVLAGPLFGLILAFFAYLFLFVFSSFIVQKILFFIFKVNIFWTCLNLIPLLPLDGGQLLRIVLDSLFKIKGVRAAYAISAVVAIVFSIFCLYRGDWFISAFTLFFGFDNWNRFMSMRKFTEYDRSEKIQERFEEGQACVIRKEEEKALRIFEEVEQKTEKGAICDAARMAMLKIYYAREEYSHAYFLLKQIVAISWTHEELAMCQKLCFYVQEYRKAIKYGKALFEKVIEPECALILAFCHAHLREVDEAVGWLTTAACHGLTDLPEVLSRQDFDLIRDDPKFQKLEQEFM